MGEGSTRPERWDNCPACGYQNGEWETRCQKCGRRFLEAVRGNAGTTSPDPSRIRRAAKGAPPRPSFPEPLRRELRTRVEQFRSRKENQPLSLPFEEADSRGKIVSFPAPPAPEEHGSQSKSLREARAPDVSARPAPPSTLNFPPRSPQPERWRALPVAPFRLRMAGHLKDAACVGGTVAVFLVPFLFLAGSARLSLALLAGVLCGSVLLGLLYGLLFLCWLGVTPGMKSAGLRVVNFDGVPADARRRLLRLAGAIVSAGSFLLGFLWALFDEEKLYWHDHISKTFLTTVHSQRHARN